MEIIQKPYRKVEWRLQIGKVGNKEQGLVQFTKIVLKGDVNKKLFGPDDLVVRLTLTNQVKKNM